MLDKKPLETDEWRPVARKRKNTKRAVVALREGSIDIFGGSL